jgi:transcriptional regulator with XRE-family HTH domain
VGLVQIVAENLRALRKGQKLSQEVLARRARVSVSYVSMLERGERTPSFDTLEALAKALRISPLYLLQEGAPGGRKKRGR